MKRTIFVLILTLVMSACGPAGDFAIGAVAYDEGDYETAIDMFKASAEQGYVKAQFNLGQMYRRGEGSPTDYEQAAARRVRERLGQPRALDCGWCVVLPQQKRSGAGQVDATG